MNGARLGIDLGGSKIEIAALDRQGAFLLRERVPTPKGDYDATVHAMVDLVVAAEKRLGTTGLPLGVGIPGSLSPRTGLVRNANSVVLNGRPLRHDLQALLGRPVRLENDANCLALSEAVDGAAAGSEVVFAVILGTGVGAGIAVRGQVLVGRNAIAGEWGHNPMLIEPDQAAESRHCWCGRSDCVETWLSGPGFAATHAQLAGNALQARQIVSAMHAGDVLAAASLHHYMRQLARALAGVVNLLDPDVIVLGGGMSQVGELYEMVPRLWGRWIFSDSVRTPVRPALHGDSSGVRGAAWLAGPGPGLALCSR